MKKYQINEKQDLFIINDLFQGKERISRLKFHILKDDYFGTLSTILKIIADEGNINEVLTRYAEDLDYLQKNYKIIKR